MYLRAFNPEDEHWPIYSRPEHNRTLPELWQQVIVPAINIREPDPEGFWKRNRAYYQVTLNVWSDLMGDTPLGAIDEPLLAEWRTKIMQRPGRTPGQPCSPETVRRHWRYVHAMLTVLYQARIIDRVPSIRMPRVSTQPGDEPVITTQTWSQLFRGCTAWRMTKDRRIPGPLVGRGVIIWLFSTGLRAADLFSLERSDVRTEPHCPVQRLAHLRNEHGWLYSENSKAHKPSLIPLTAPARRWFDLTAELLSPRSQHCGQLLPLGNPVSHSRDAHERQEMRRAIHAAAGMETVYSFHELRDGANETWNDAEEDAGDWLLGHAANRNVNSKHYRSGVRRLLRALPNLAIPEAFSSIH